MGSTMGLTHKTSHTYKVGDRVYANNLEPHQVLEVVKTGATASSAPLTLVKAKSQPAYSAPTITDANRETILIAIEQSLLNHENSSDSHSVDTLDYLFSSSSSVSRFEQFGNNYRMEVATDPNFSLSDVRGALQELRYITEYEQEQANQMKKEGTSGEAIVAWIKEFRRNLKFSLDDVPDVKGEFVVLTDKEQEVADEMRKNGSNDDEIVTYLRTTRRAYNDDPDNYSNITDLGADLDVHETSVDSHKDNLKSVALMMHHANTSYHIGDVVHIGELPEYLALTATNNGVTGKTRPDFAKVLDLDEEYVEPDKDAEIERRINAIRAKLKTSDSTTVNKEILALHREVYDHQYDPDAHSMGSTSKLVHKTNHEYSRAGVCVYANNLTPILMLEVYQTGRTDSTAPGAAVKSRTNGAASYTAPVITDVNREEILNEVQEMFDAHKASTTAHKQDMTDYLFETNSSGYQLVRTRNANGTTANCYRLCSLAS